MSERKVRVFSISGIIGVGKSTLMDGLMQSTYFRNLLNGDVTLCFVKEPSDLWREMGWLAAFYADKKKRAYPFQNLVFDTHVDAVLDGLANTIGDDVVCIVERCMYDQLLFWKIQSKVDPMEDTSYCRMWRKWKMLIPPVRKIFFYQTSTLEKTIAREKARARPEELTGIDEQYRLALFNKHLEWYTTPMTSIPVGDSIPCVYINADADLGDKTEFEAIAQRIATEINATIH